MAWAKPRPSQSWGFQAKPGQNNTKSKALDLQGIQAKIKTHFNGPSSECR
jgi:hypothetical protein